MLKEKMDKDDLMEGAYLRPECPLELSPMQYVDSVPFGSFVFRVTG